jgi:hypothetical protein
MMKRKLKGLLFALCAFSLGVTSVEAATRVDADYVFDGAEDYFPQYFNARLDTLSLGSNWPYYRGPYPHSEGPVYVGINDEDDVYVLGGPFGSEPLRVNRLSYFIAFFQERDSQVEGNEACSQENLPAGTNYSEDGNNITISTDGCIALDEQAPLCEPVSMTLTDNSVLTTTNFSRYDVGGIEVSGLPIDIPTILQDSINFSSCTINAPAELQTYQIDLDVCFELPGAFGDLEGLPGVVVTPPVTVDLEGRFESQVVPDCFATNASIIVDAYSGEVWVADGFGVGGYQKIE